MVEENAIKVENGILCKLCKTVLKNAYNFKYHIRDRHFNKAYGIFYECPKCEHKTSSRNVMRFHLTCKHPELKGLSVDLLKVDEI